MEPTNCSNGGIGYQEPNVECHLANVDDATLSRLSSSASAKDNDRAITGLKVWFVDNDEGYHHREDNWYKELGGAIGSSQQLRTLRIQDTAFENVSHTKSFLKQVATNRSIEHFSLNGILLFSEFEIFRVFAPFVAYNQNLRSIEFVSHNWDLTGINDFISVLAQSKTIRLENIALISTAMGDHTTTCFCNALSSISGLSHLRNLNLGGNKIGRAAYWPTRIPICYS
jgi:hypothetical protein